VGQHDARQRVARQREEIAEIIRTEEQIRQIIDTASEEKHDAIHDFLATVKVAKPKNQS
jgi:uncharacterized membrane protein